MVVIVDYGFSNLLSIQRAVGLFDSESVVSGAVEDIVKADKIILPGVGSFDKGMKELMARGLDKIIISKAQSGTPILGICLGMQFLLDDSEEGEYSRGLGLIHGNVKKISAHDIEGNEQKVPHIGWSPLKKHSIHESSINILEGINDCDEVYFVHSYEAIVKENNLLATVEYGGRNIAAVIQNGNVIGCQFHPEKSGVVGLNIVENFIRG